MFVGVIQGCELRRWQFILLSLWSVAMLVGYHLSFSAYGFWLPNDPRGSWSQFVGKWELYQVGGKATKTVEKRSLAHDPHNRALRLASIEKLDRNAVKFTPQQVQSIARGFAGYILKSQLEVWACAIMPDHIHIVFAPHRLEPNAIANKLKGAATTQLLRDKLHPFQEQWSNDKPGPKCFARGEWVIFIHESDVAWHIDYVEQNPIKAGLEPQVWDFVQRRCANEPTDAT